MKFSQVSRLTTLGLLIAAPPATAQLYLGTRPNDKVQVVDLGAGYLRGPVPLDVAATASPPLDGHDALTQAARIGDEIWVVASNAVLPENRVYRYDATSLTFLGASVTLAGKGTSGLVEAGGRAWLVSRKSLFELALDGTLLNTHPVDAGAGLALGAGELLVSNRDLRRIDSYDLTGAFAGVFSAPSEPLFQDPGRLRVRESGNLLVVCTSRVFELDVLGQVVDEHLCTPALDVVETSGGYLVSTQSAPWLLLCDPFADGTGLVIQGASYHAPLGRTGAVRFCPATANSSGTPASIALVGSLRVKKNDLRLVATRCPAAKTGAFLFGLTRTQVPFGDGVLCIGSGAVRLPTVATDGFGVVVQTVSLKAPPLAGALLPGVRGHFQFAFLDPTGGPAGLNLSDAVAVTFLP